MTPREEAPRGPLADRSVLVTGGTGSFGSAFVTHALSRGARRVVVYSRDELKQAHMRASIKDDRLRTFLGDVRDVSRLRRALEGIDLVVHAAALKRIEAGEQDAGEFVKTNVGGTVNVIEASHDACVERAVLLSTDKASQPTTLYGSTKHTAERLFRAANNARGATGPLYAATRYGNVSGSRGSVIPRWREQQARGEPVAVTDMECTRYWMLLSEAVALVEWTLGNMVGGEVVVPDLPAYQVADLVRAMKVEAWYTTSLSSGEKKHESMIGQDELSMFRRHGPYWSTCGTGEAPRAPLTSDTAPRLSVPDLRERLGFLEVAA